MARPNRTRSIESETNLARRIAFEREQRNLSYESLAKLMTDAGCAIQGSAIYKIEKSDPPRRVAVDELVALSKVFELSLDDLVTPMELINQRRVQEILKQVEIAGNQLSDFTDTYINLLAESFEIAKDNWELWEYLMGHWFGKPKPEEKISVGSIEIDGVTIDDDMDDLKDAISQFTIALVGVAARISDISLEDHNGQH